MSTERHSSYIGQYSEADLEEFIRRNYGHSVSMLGKSKTLIKFGSNNDVATSLEDVNNVGGVESLPTDNLITHIASANAGDTHSMVIEGHTIDGSGNLTFVVQSVNLAGQTKTALPTPLARATRAYNDASTSLAGIVYVARDVTFTAGVPASDIHLKVDLGYEQSQKCSTSVSQSDYWAITQLSASVRRQQTRKVDFYVQIREQGKVWRTRFHPLTVSDTSGTISIHTEIPFIIRPNSDVRVQAVSSGTATEVGAALFGTLLKILN